MQTTEQWGIFEITLTGPQAGNPFLDVTLTATFNYHHRAITIDGFYDGAGVYKIRFMPDTAGEWSYVTQSNAPELDGRCGAFTCTLATGGNHGPVHVADRYHFAYADRTPYHPVGTTCYVWNHQGEALEAQTLDTLKHAPFNKMRMCVFPKRYAFNKNEPPCYPFEGEVKQPLPTPDYWDFTRFNPAYFRRLEQHLLALQHLGLEADLILFHPYDSGAWGFDRMPAEVNDRYLRYLVARVAAFRNVWWSFANEYDFLSDLTLTDWDHYFQLVQTCDPYDHLRSIHNCFAFYDHGKPWVTHCSIQHHDLFKVPEWMKQYGKPVVMDECGYEGDLNYIWGSLSAEEMVLRFWLGFASGGYVGHGETYWNQKEVLWWSKGGQLHGESAPRIAFLRQVIEATPGYGLAPIIESPHAIIPEGNWNKIAAGYHGADYYLFYFGMHQPRFREFCLPDGNFRIELLDTWNMTVTTAMERACGRVQVELPGQKFLALRIIKTT